MARASPASTGLPLAAWTWAPSTGRRMARGSSWSTARRLRRRPFDWPANGPRILVVGGGPPPHPDLPGENPNDFGVYSVGTLGGFDLRRLSSSPDRAEDELFGSSADGSWLFVNRTPWGLQDAQQLP